MSASTRPAYRGGTVKIAIILYGPKGSGKSRIAQMLAQRLGVHHVDPDTLSSRGSRKGSSPTLRTARLPKCTATY